ncbi:RNA methyltransferase [Marilutibacter alkalisoli]|uniref:tRNA (cytidine/uridine-2'-O-)-methyltransferase TrmJ n=1 Tax=Marilutibacter alkalisoli TaxID=2591633 RepID=A0A514BQ20_9GAMM|nr:RNA methyltransferase [Lysobacter alkalisoli]QDH69480.1 RNA methyltransferase [Lysobacter alkalisoli]
MTTRTLPELHTPESLAGRLRIVLVGTQHPGNIGSAARAMKTMGLHRLVLVAPERAPNHESEALAAGADDVLSDAVTCATLAEAVADCRLVLGCTARSRRIALDEMMPRDAAARAVASAMAGGEVALVFGRERTGLDNEELQLCHAAVHIPANPDYSSLNLAAAVQVLAYELRLALLATGDGGAATERMEPPATHAELEGFFTQLGGVLDMIDFHKGRAPESALRKFRRLFLRAGLDAREVRLLRGMLADVERTARLAGMNGSETDS